MVGNTTILSVMYLCLHRVEFLHNAINSPGPIHDSGIAESEIFHAEL